MEGVLAQVGVVLHQFQTIGSIPLVLGRGVVILSVFGAHHSDDFSSFALLLGHGIPLLV